MTEKQTIYYELLVLRCKRGQKDAFQELVRAWEKPLFYYVRRLVDNGEGAWQIMQDTWLKVISNIKKLREPKKLPSWLYWIIGAFFGLLFAALSAYILKKGTVNLKTDELSSAWLGWGFVVIVATITLVYSGDLPDPIIGVRMLAASLFSKWPQESSC